MRFAEGSTKINVRKHPLRCTIASGLCLVLVGQPIAADAAMKKKISPAIKQIEGEDRILHALNRLTFGPRPGDVTAVQAMGLDKWIDRQLNPESIDDSALGTRLSMFPAMKLEQAELMRRYPNPAVLQMMTQTNLPLPADPVEHAIYKDSIAFYEMARAKQLAAQTGGATEKSQADTEMAKGTNGSSTALPGDSVDPAIPAMTAHEEQFYSGLDVVRIRRPPRSTLFPYTTRCR